MEETSEEALWLALAELFFLDTEPDQREYEMVAASLQKAGWTRAQTAATLTDLIAPLVGANLGYLFYPVIGAWSGFDAEELIPRIRSLKQKREMHPRWYFMLQDWNSRRMLHILDMERLLKLLPA